MSVVVTAVVVTAVVTVIVMAISTIQYTHRVHSTFIIYNIVNKTLALY